MSASGPPWLIAAAVEQEIQGLRTGLRAGQPLSGQHENAWEGHWRGTRLLLVRTGVGPQQARQGLSPFLNGDPYRGILSIGYAGGLKDECKLGDILVPEEVRSVPPLPEVCFRPDPDLRKKVLTLASNGPWKIHTGRMITSDHVVITSEEKHGLGRAYDAASVEMESAVVAELADQASLPCVVVRVVLDEASFSLPDMIQVFRWYRKRQFGKLIPYLVTHPLKLLELLGLLQRSRKASKALNDLFLARLLDGLTEAD